MNIGGKFRGKIVTRFAMRKTAHILGFVLALSSPLAFGQTVCTPTLSGGFDCHDYATGTSSIITPRLGYHTYGIGGRPPSHHHGDGLGRYGAPTIAPFGPVEPPRTSGGYHVYNYGTGESAIIAPRFGGGFTIDKY